MVYVLLMVAGGSAIGAAPDAGPQSMRGRPPLAASVSAACEPASWTRSDWEFEPESSGTLRLESPVMEFAQQHPAAPSVRAEEVAPRSDLQPLRRHKAGFLQRVGVSAEWTPRFGDTGLGVTTLKTSATAAVPLGSFQNLLLITPGFEVATVDAPAGVEIPDELYNADIDFMWRKQLTERWGAMVGVTPGYSSDFQSSDGAIRIRGRGFATWEWLPDRLTLLMGVVYLDRNDLPLLPGVGLTWTPVPEWRLELLFPRPKLAYRLEFIPGLRERWVYLSGQLGGRTWAVERRSGMTDELTLRDIAIAVGWEQLRDGGGGAFAEFGWSLGRELEYDLAAPLRYSFDDAVFLRGGISY